MDSSRTSTALVAIAAVVGVPAFFNFSGQIAERWGRGSAAGAHMSRGEKALRDGRFIEAAAAYGRAREVDPGSPEAQKGLMRARAGIVAEQPARIVVDNVEEMKYELNFLLDTDRPRAGIYLTALGNVSARLGNLDDARARYEAALKADPKSALAHVALGSTWMGQKETADKARAEFEEALKLKADSATALMGIAQIAASEGKADVAMEKAEAVLKIGEDVQAHLLLGNLLLGAKKPEDGLKHFQRAAQLDPRNVEAIRAAGQTLLQLNKPEDAERVLRAAIGISPDPASVLALGFALSRQKKNEAALVAFNTVLQQDANNGPAIFGAALVMEDVGKRAEATLLYKKLLSIQSPPGPAGQLLGQLQGQANDRLKELEAGGAAPAAAASGAARPRPRKG